MSLEPVFKYIALPEGKGFGEATKEAESESVKLFVITALIFGDQACYHCQNSNQRQGCCKSVV